MERYVYYNMLKKKRKNCFLSILFIKKRKINGINKKKKMTTD